MALETKPRERERRLPDLDAEEELDLGRYWQRPLALAQNVEKSQVVTPARWSKTTARSRRNSVLVGALIGLVLGLIAALLWIPAARVVRRTSVQLQHVL